MELKKIVKNILLKISALIILFFLIPYKSDAQKKYEPFDYSSEPVKVVNAYQVVLKNKDYKTIWVLMTKVDRDFFHGNYAKKMFVNTTIDSFCGNAHLKKIRYITDKRIWIELSDSDIKKINKALIDRRFQGFPCLIKDDSQWKIADTARYFHTAINDMKSLSIAIQNYYRANNHLPAQLSSLVYPVAYIPKIPIDVFNDAQEPYRYRVVDNKTYLLYSFGPDSDDDSGATEYNPNKGEISDGDIIHTATVFSLIEKIYPIDCSSKIIKFVLGHQKALRNRDFKTMWNSMIKPHQEIFENKYAKFKEWHLMRIKTDPKIYNIFAIADLKEIIYINDKRIWIEFYSLYPDIHKSDPTTRGYYLLKENNIWKFGSLAKFMRIKVENDMKSLSIAIQNYYRANNHLPAQLSSLVYPVAYIPKIPIDVFNDAQEPYRYRVVDNKTYLLYSFGPDSDDDSGEVEYNIKNDPISNGDIVLKIQIE